jgi:paraquat-inducible protein A
VLLVAACTMPFLTVSLQGRIQEANLVTGAAELFAQGFWTLAAVVLATTILAPAVKLGATLYVLLALRLPHPPRHVGRVFRWLDHLRSWSMIEVYLLGVFVAYVKLVEFYTIGIGPAFYAIASVMILMVALDVTLSPDIVWREMERRGIVGQPGPAAADAPLVLCESCNLLAPMRRRHEPCPRCGAARHTRKPESLVWTWALVISALILYIPANVFPVMTVISLGKGEPDTILSGVKTLFLAGMWPLALVVFFASITVPVLKITGLVLLLVTTHWRSRWRLRDRTVLYRIVENVGRWSMIDVFMISILVGLVRLGSLATIEPGVGAVSFAAVVIITMFAAEAFDPRLMWDAAGENR